MLEEFKTDEILIAHANQKITKTFMAKMGDDQGRALKVQITDEGEVVDMTGYSVYLLWAHESGIHKGIETFEAVDATQGVYSIDYPPTMLNHAGMLHAYVQMVDSKGAIINTLTFRIYVQGDEGITSGTEAGDLYDTFKELMRRFEEMIASSGLGIKGSYDSYEELIKAHPTGTMGDAYIVGNDLYLWNDGAWKNVGRFKGEDGTTPHIGTNGNWFIGETDTGKPSRGIQGERGSQGVKGEQGIQGEKGEQGATGAPGKAATVKVGKVTTGAAGSTVTISNSGTENAAVLDFTIPRGDKGEPGDGGVPTEGTAGQVLTKTDAGNAWKDLPAVVEPTAARLREIMSVPAVETVSENVLKLKTPDEKPAVLAIDAGGTGASTAKAARYNLFADTPNEAASVNDGSVMLFGYASPLVGNGAVYRNTASKLWDYIKTKASAVFAAIGHKHVKADITDFPASMPASDVSAWAKAATKPTYTANEVGAAAKAHTHSASDISSGTLAADRLGDVPASKLSGIIDSSNLPSYVDDVITATLATFPKTGEAGKIYIDQNTNKSYRWSGSGYVEIGKSLALGETSATAYRGDRGKIAYDHSQAKGNPHGLTISNLVSGGTAGQVLTKTDGGASWADPTGGEAPKTRQAGIVYPFAGMSNAVPEGFLLCDGAQYSTADYPELYAVIGDAYTIGEPAGKFNVPDLRARTIVGEGELSEGSEKFAFQRGNTGGEVKHTLTVNEMPSHTHSPNITNGAKILYNQSGSIKVGSGTGTVTQVELKSSNSNTGGGQAHMNMQPFGVANWIISTGKKPAQAVEVGEIRKHVFAESELKYKFNLYSSMRTILVRNGNVVCFSGQFKIKTETMGSTTELQVLDIPEGYSPVESVHELCQGTSVNKFYALFGSGKLTISRYSDANGYTTMKTSNWFPVSATWITEDPMPANG